MRLVLDTNVLISAYVFRGICGDLFEHCIRYHEIVTSVQILDELHDTMVCKFGYGSSDVLAITNQFRERVIVVIPIELPHPVCRDPDDDVILGTALAAEAELLVTGDNDLLVFERFADIEIIRPSDFLEYESRSKR